MAKKKTYYDMEPEQEEEVCSFEDTTEETFPVEDTQPFVPVVEPVIKEAPKRDEGKLPMIYKRFDQKAVDCLLKNSYQRLRGVYRSALFTGEFVEGKQVAFAISLVVATIASDGILYVPEDYPYTDLFDCRMQRGESMYGFIAYRKP